MIKVFLLVLFLVPFLFPQQSNNGNISLVYNGEKINLPINTITIQKGNEILLSIKAVKNDSVIQQMVVLELGLKELSSEPDAETLRGTKIEISTRDNITGSGKELSFRFGDEKDKSDTAYYSVLNKGKKSSWRINSVSMKINITDVKYTGGVLHLTGECTGTFKSTEAPEGQTAEIKDCRFEIVI
jgi:hypothetical protein